MTDRHFFAPLKHVIALVAAVALAFTLSTPRAARADPGEAIAAGIIGLAIICGVSGQCTKNKRTTARGGYGDAIGLSGQTAMWVQGGLQNLGFYTGAIDGAIGNGTRNSIRAYQAAIGTNQTGALTGQQINDLVALSPGFFSYPAGDPYLFNADLANDLDRDGIRQLQDALNRQGYPAGAVDGALGNQTRTAIISYKAANGLPGQPVASRRLLARLMGWAAPEPAGKHIVNARAGIAPAPAPLPVAPPSAVIPQAGIVGPQAVAPMPQANLVVPQPPAPAPALSLDSLTASATAVPAGDLTFDILGVELGMSEAQVKGTLMAQLGGSLMFDSTDAAAMGAGGAATKAFLTVQPEWPQAPAEQVVVLFDEARPELGAVAIFRMIRMPEGIDQTTFETQVLPDIVANYGDAGLQAGSARWIGSAAARGASNPAACGDPRLSVDTGVATALDALWRSGGGPRLDGGLGSVVADCGQVLSVDYAGAVIRIGLWDTAALANLSTAGTSAPKIKF